MQTLRRAFALIAGYTIAVIVASMVCLLCLYMLQLSGLLPLGRGGVAGIGLSGTWLGGMGITASTAWPGYLLTAWLLLSKRMSNRIPILAIAGALTAVQACVLMSVVIRASIVMLVLPTAIIGGIVGAIAFSLVAERLFGMTLLRLNRSPSPSKS